jgi:hypothetical protein
LKQTAKGFFRLGLCDMNLNNLEEAKTELTKASELDEQIMPDVA